MNFTLNVNCANAHDAATLIAAVGKHDDVLQQVLSALKGIAMTQAEMVTALQGLGTKLDATGQTVTKISGETTSLLKKIDALQAIIDAGGSITQELVDAFKAVDASANNLGTLVSNVDAQVPDLQAAAKKIK